MPFLLALALVAGLTPISPAGAQGECYQTGWFSEEGRAGGFCQSGFAVRAIRCSGAYCDNKQLECCRYAPGTDRSAGFGWSSWFSEEGGEAGRQRADNNGFVAGLACRGAYCDNLRLNFVYTPRLANTRDCRYTPPFSEEGGARQSCGPGEFVSGIRCAGAYCDNLELYCCRAAPR